MTFFYELNVERLLNGPFLLGTARLIASRLISRRTLEHSFVQNSEGYGGSKGFNRCSILSFYDFLFFKISFGNGIFHFC